MNSSNFKSTILLVCIGLLGILTFATDSQAVTGYVKVYYGLTTTYTPTVVDHNNNTVVTAASATGTGDGGTVSIPGTGNNRANGYQYNGTNDSNDNYQNVVVTPTSPNKIASIKLIRTYTDGSTDTVTDIAITGNGTVATTFRVNVKRNRFYILIVDFDNNTQFTLNYSIVADVAATPATTCNGSATVVPQAPYAFATGTTVNVPVANTGVTYLIGNTQTSCQVDAININGTWDSTVWNATTHLYTTPNITANTTFQIRYKGSNYTVTTGVDPAGDITCGSISPGTQIYGAGSSPIFTVLVNPGCAVQSFTDNSSTASLTAANNYTLSSLSANHTLTVKFSRVLQNTSSNYCQVPPFMDGTSILKPNVLIIFDTSGSMGQNPYSNKTYNCTETSTLNNCSNFDGYFAKNKMYTLVSGKYMIDTTTTLNLANSNSSGTLPGRGLSGNFLNYKNMHKVDILRFILVGGQVDPTNGASRTNTTGATRYLSTDAGQIIEYGTTNPTGLLHLIADKVNLGMMVFNPNEGNGTLNDDGAVLSAEIGSSLDTLVAQIESTDTDPSGFTPLAESLYEAFRYFQGGASYYNSYNTASPSSSSLVSYAGTATDALSPHRVYKKPIQGSCQSNFILVITDGAPTNDSVAPMTSSTIDSSLYNWLTTHNTGPSTQLGKLSYYIRNFNLATGASSWGLPADPSKRQVLTVSYIFSFGDTTGASTLKDAAKYGSYLEDKSITAGTNTSDVYGKTNSNGIPDRFSEWTTVQPVSPANPTTSTASFTDVRGYYEADDGALLASQLQSYFNNIINNTASGTAASVANNKSGQRGANMIQALFYPQFPTNPAIKWLGEVQALWYYLDPVINYSAIFEDSNSDGALDLRLDNLLPADPFDTKSLWRAGAMLHKATADSRHIYTLLDTSASTALTPIDLTTGTTNSFATTNRTTLKPLLNASTLTDTQTDTLINYLRGVDNAVYRSRAVDYTYTRPESAVSSSTSTLGATTGATTSTSTGEGVWKLGDIINSTPIVQSSVPVNAYDVAYSDSSYKKFLSTTQYKARNIVYTGSNDGMLHAFRLGNSTNSTDVTQPFKIASITGSQLGTEEWAFIPHNALPYLQNQCAGDYCHEYIVDGAPTVVDASINNTCGASNYWECVRTTVTTTSGTNISLDAAASSWRTVLVSSMGLGGASRDSAVSCNETTSATVKTDCVKTPVADNGLSSYFALDVTDPIHPKYMWEFSDYSIKNDSTNAVMTADGSRKADEGLGFTTAGTAIMRINTSPEQKSKNGRWFAVFASGPTGSIDSATKSFSGRSDQNLKLYIVDLNGGSTFTKCTGAGQSGCNYWVKDTGIKYAFANSLSGAAIDLDRWNSLNDGNFSDSVLYVTYTKATLTAGGKPVSTTAWNRGGVMRLVTNHDPDPYFWFTSPLIGETNCASSVAADTGCVGPITTSVARIQDRNSHKLWLYFGEGRYFFPGDERLIDRKIYGVQDPCYNQYSDTANMPTRSPMLRTGDGYQNYAMGTSATYCPSFDLNTLQDQSGTTPSSTLTSGKNGWFISLSSPSGSAGSERVVSDVSATFNGLVFFTTYTPNTDVCTPGGSTSLWAVQYNTGGTPPAASLQGKAPIQTSSGGISLINLATAFTQQGGRKLNAALSPSGMAPKGKFPALMSPKATRSVLQIQEK